ncbi:uncharacterized protein LOC133900829 [Phragmites australis]|uniref:uncharacterized protein LOC133900829 n=1 Tax=Phragmites australis TaxID=29695 RepID=UPI002D777233|nr:uncharacterized protein LOC133900829 [Phragmites australis]
MKKVRARRQRIPAFGEWNYDYGSGSDWPVTQYFDSAMQPGLVMALPPSPKHVKKVVKWSDSPALDDDEKQQPRHTVVVGLAEHGMKKQGKQSRVADTRAHAADCNYKACRVVRAVDEDLYEIPPDMLCPHEPRKRLTKRSLWMGCLGLSCIA